MTGCCMAQHKDALGLWVSPYMLRPLDRLLPGTTAEISTPGKNLGSAKGMQQANGPLLRRQGASLVWSWAASEDQPAKSVITVTKLAIIKSKRANQHPGMLRSSMLKGEHNENMEEKGTHEAPAAWPRVPHATS